MTAKHLTKNTILHKFVFLAAIVAVAMAAAFFICATSQANAETQEGNQAVANLVNKDNLNAAESDRAKSQINASILETVCLYGTGGIYELSASSDGWGDNEIIQPIKENWVSGENLTNYFKQELIDVIDSVYVWQVCYKEADAYHLYLNVKLDDDDEGRYAGYTFEQKVDLTFENPTWSYTNKSGKQDVVPDEYADPIVISTSTGWSFYNPTGKPTSGINIEGHVADADNVWQPVPGAFVQYCQWNSWFWDYVPVPEMSTFTDWFGNYTIEGVTEEMLPGVIRVYRFGYEVGESWPIWGAPEGEDTVYRFIQMTPAEPPVPPTPPTPPDPPVPPQPDPPQPVPPTPVPPTPTPDNPGGGIAQTGDTTSSACAVFAMLALCGTCGFAACAKRRKFDK